MKPTTLNFWTGVLVGIGIMSFGPGFIKGFKKGFKEGFYKEVKDDRSKPIVDNRGDSYKARSRFDNDSVSKLKEVYDTITSEYKAKSETEDDLENFVTIGYGNGSKYAIDPEFIKAGKFDYSNLKIDQSILNGPKVTSITYDKDSNSTIDIDSDEFKNLDS